YQIWFDAEDFVSCSGLPDFVLTGPGVSVETPIDAGTGAAAEETVTFQPGVTYVAFDRGQTTLSRIAFTTAASGTAAQVSGPSNTGSTGKVDNSANGGPVGSSVAKSSSPAVQRGTLIGKVGANGGVTLTFQGKLVSQLKAGVYTFTVTDASKKS